MIKIERFVVNMLQENCYVVSDETKQAIIIDCGAFFDNDRERINEYIKENELKITHLICTHGHFDHILGTKFVFDNYNVKPELHSADVRLYNHCNEQIEEFTGVAGNTEVAPLGKNVDETSKISFRQPHFYYNINSRTYFGGVSFYCSEEKVLFTGDSLFYCCIGRCDLPDGDESVLINALKQNILPLPDDTTVYPGHGCGTQIGFERKHNPYISTLN